MIFDFKYFLQFSSINRNHGYLLNFTRNVSSKHFRPHPRPYRRRLFEAALAPIIPKELEKEKRRLTENYIYSIQGPIRDGSQLSPIELAFANEVEKWIKTEEFRLVAVCQLLWVNGSELWLGRNQFRLKGLEVCEKSSRIMNKVFEKSSLRTLKVALLTNTRVVFGKELSSIKSLFSECQKYPWITPLAVAMDNRILSISHARELAKLGSLEDLRAQTTQILAQIPQQIVQTIDSPINHLTFSLNSLETTLSSNGTQK